MALHPGDPAVRVRMAAVLLATGAAVAANACTRLDPPAVPTPTEAGGPASAPVVLRMSHTSM